MKPLRLELSAFGPFAGREVVDFSEIEGAQLLLIHGPTGSGKTTLLDAICFALFGDTSGAEREGKQMRSDNAEPTVRTEVIYDFSLGERHYRVSRQPEQQRPSKRGGGMTKDAHNATLWERDASARAAEPGTPEFEGRVLAAKANKVTEAIETIFGFESEQFRQVVLLPQGQFRKLLMASSQDKQTILQKLFQTQLYDKLEKSLTERASKLRRSFEDEQLRMTAILDQAKVENVEQLQGLLKQSEELWQSAHVAQPLAAKRAVAAAKLWDESKRHAEFRQKWVEAKTALGALQAQAPDMDGLRKQQVQARKAEPLHVQLQAVQSQEKLARSAAEQVEVASRALAQAQARLQDAMLKLSTEEANKPELQRAAEELTRLQGMYKKVEALDRSQQVLQGLQQTEKSQQEQVASHQNKVEEATKQRDSQRLTLEKTTEQASQCQAMDLVVANARTLCERAEALTQLARQKQVQGKAHAACESQRRAAHKQLDVCIAVATERENAWRKGQAGALAQQLAEGKSCPVCGSEQHPEPAASSANTPTEDSLDKARQAVDSARQSLELCDGQLAVALASLRATTEKYDTFQAELGEAAQLPAQELAEQLQQAVQAASRASTAAKNLPAVRQAVAQSDSTMGQAVTAQETARQALSGAREAVAAAHAQCEELKKQVPEAYRKLDAVVKAGKSIRAQCETFEQSLAKAIAARDKAAVDLSAAQARTEQSQQAVQASSEQAVASRALFEQTRIDAGFADASAFELACQQVLKLPHWDATLRAYEGALQAAVERNERAEAEAKELPPPGQEDLQALSEAAAELARLAVIAETNAAKDKQRVEEYSASHEKVRSTVASLEEQWQLVESVAGLASGKAPPKISFQRFVLGALLDEVLLAATERLSRMSKGRYSLCRQIGTSHKGRAGGLDLEVMDQYTGASRPVATLSGGESFLAALALSLGLADVVQSYSGGIRLDTLFIDEGFGTLDSDALDLALDTLSEINAEGRLVGIISHVQELKNRIGTRLELTASEKGSHARFARA